jgi:hypothetical protein
MRKTKRHRRMREKRRKRYVSPEVYVIETELATYKLQPWEIEDRWSVWRSKASPNESFVTQDPSP